MDLNSPDTWRWLWLVAMGVFLVGEIATPATFFFLPFAFGAVLAAALAFLGASLPVEWVVFVLLSIAAFAGLWPLGRRLERADSEQEGVGATRWIGREAQVSEAIAAGGFGTVRLEREVWRAESMTGDAIATGATVLVTRVAGTRLVVVPVEITSEQSSSEHNGPGPDQGAS